MFSATMAPKIRNLAREILQDPAEVSVAISKPAEGVTQLVYLAHEDQKIGLTQHLLKDKDTFTSIIIFCSTKRKVEQLTRKLAQRNYAVKGMSSDYEQEAREKALAEFKSGRIRIMVATDVMSRGIDIKGIDLVINYDVPNDAEDYVHRIGRTARAKTEGMAITYVAPEDMYKFTKIERLVERDYEKLPAPEHLGVSPVWEVAPKGANRRNNRSKRRGDTPKGEGKPQGFGAASGKKKRWRGPKRSGGGALQA
jgi:superfamily II DNA/RNA helicase